MREFTNRFGDLRMVVRGEEVQAVLEGYEATTLVVGGKFLQVVQPYYEVLQALGMEP